MSNASFLPEDYLAQKAERRTNIICLTLFGVVMGVVFLLFLFTNRQLSNVKADQEQINGRYQQAALQIKELNELEEQKAQMLEKAELAAALVERVPRSILLAELINRMPDRLGLLNLELKSDRIKVVTPMPAAGSTGRLKGKPARAQTKEDAQQVLNKIEAPRYEVSIVLVGIAPSDVEVARYMAELNAYELLDDVTMEYSAQTDFDGRRMREFRIHMKLDNQADVRHIEPLFHDKKIRNPMSDEIELIPPGGNTVQVLPGKSEGN